MSTTANRTFTILLVDDREENLISLEEILEGDGRVFIRAQSGNEALKQVLKNEDIGLILLDVQMPGMDGFEVAKLLKSNAKTKDISIVFVTAINKEEQYVLKGFETGAVDYLQKPLDINVCKAKVNVFEQLYFYQKDLKTTMADLSKINKQLEQFVYVVAHDLKSPLSGIIGMLYILNEEKDISDNPQLRSYIDLIFSATNHLSGMISSILDYSKRSLDQQTIEPVDVDEMVRQIAHLLFPPAHIKIDIDAKMPVLNTRKLKLQQVFQNLISNAIKYNDKPGGKIQVGVNDKDGEYEFYVKDNGPGIKDADQERVFKLFETTDNISGSDSSTGVGLNIIKLIVEEQGGKIWVESNPGVGSTFFFTWKK
jgi:two-component system, sensor histidine kinase and response regulator